MHELIETLCVETHFGLRFDSLSLLRTFKQSQKIKLLKTVNPSHFLNGIEIRNICFVLKESHLVLHEYTYRTFVLIFRNQKTQNCKFASFILKIHSSITQSWTCDFRVLISHNCGVVCFSIHVKTLEYSLTLYTGKRNQLSNIPPLTPVSRSNLSVSIF